MANVHGSLSRLAPYRSDLQFPYENMAEVKRNRRHSCYPDTVLSLLPFFRRNSGLSETADLNQFPPFVQCRVSSARPQEGISGRPYRTLCPRNPYTDDLTDDEDDVSALYCGIKFMTSIFSGISSVVRYWQLWLCTSLIPFILRAGTDLWLQLIESIDDEASNSFWSHLGLVVTTLVTGSPEYFRCMSTAILFDLLIYNLLS